MEKAPIVGWFEDDLGNIITLLKGEAFLTFGKKVVTFKTPEDVYSSNPVVIAKMIASHLPTYKVGAEAGV